MSKIIILYLMFFNLFSEKTPEHIKLSNEVSNSFTKDETKKRNLKKIGDGGALMNNIEEVSLDYFSANYSTINEARITVVQMTEELISRYNSSEKIKPYMSNYPFNFKNINITIYYTKKKMDSCENLVSSAGPIADKIYYYLYDSRTGEETEKFIETYLEAYKIVYGHERPK